MDAARFQAFCNAIQNSQIQSLYLGRNNLCRMNTEKWQALGEALQNSQIQSLDLNHVLPA